MSRCFYKMTGPLLGLLLVAAAAHAGGIDPRDMPAAEPARRTPATVSPAQTAEAVSAARRAVAPPAAESPRVKEVPMSSARPQAAPAASPDSWLLGSREGECAPLTGVARKVKNIGAFKTPQEFTRQMQQRGYQAFALDIGEKPDQVMRVKVPDLELDLLFVRPNSCR